MITTAWTCIPLKRIFVCNVAAGRLKGPPKERMSAATDTEKNTVAGFWAKRMSKAKKMVASRPGIRVTITGITTGIGLK
jgi:hypothetical protein